MTSAQKIKKANTSLLQRYAAAPHIVWAVLFIIAPIIFVAYYAFTATVDGAVVFSFENIKTFFTPTYLKIFARSVFLALISTAICLLLGYPIAYFISRIARERDPTQKTYELLSHLVSALFLDIIYRIVPSKDFSPKHPPNYYDQKINRFLIERYNQKICRKDLANTLFLSEKQTSRIIQKRFKCSFNELVMRWRLNVACMYLTQTSMEIYEIASSVGYEYPNLFFSHFKKSYGMSPAEYRKQQKKMKG